MNVIYHIYHFIIVFFLICACSLLYIDVTKVNSFLARDSIYAIARYMLSPVRPSVCPSVLPSHGWISQRRLKLGSRNLHHRIAHDSSFLTPNGTLKFQREDRERGRQIREGYDKNAIFSHCRYCIPIHPAALLSRADRGVSWAFLFFKQTDFYTV